MSQKPKILIIGDSISIGYTPHAAKLLGDDFAVVHNAGNATDSNNLDVNLPVYLAADADAACVHFNCGLHDIKRHRQVDHAQVPLPVYRAQLTQIVEQLLQSRKKLIWATTTPVIDERHSRVKDFERLNEDVLAYNAVAAEIVGAAGIAVNDLYAVIAAAGPQSCLADDGVHMTDEANGLLGRAVERAVRLRMEVQ